MQIAAFTGNVKVLQTLISGGANLDSMDRNGDTPLRAAILGRRPAAALLLLQRRLRVKAISGDHQDTALHLAVAFNYSIIVEALTAKGVDVDACDKYGDTPLQWAELEFESSFPVVGVIQRARSFPMPTILRTAPTSGCFNM